MNVADRLEAEFLASFLFFLFFFFLFLKKLFAKITLVELVDRNFDISIFAVISRNSRIFSREQFLTIVL